MLVLHSGNHEDEVRLGHEQLVDDDLAGGGGQDGQVGHQAQPKAGVRGGGQLREDC